MGIGMGMITGVGGTLGNAVGGMMTDSLNKAVGQPQAEQTSAGQGVQKMKCKCGAVLPPNAKFCLECGEKIEHPTAENEMICPACGAKVAKGKFCLECGASLINKCTNCGAELPQGSKFCLECGTKVK